MSGGHDHPDLADAVASVHADLVAARELMAAMNAELARLNVRVLALERE